MTSYNYVFLLKSKRLACCYIYLCLYKIHSGNKFSNRMLHLYSGIHFHKIKILIFIKKEFYSTGIDIGASLCRLYSCLSHTFSEFLIYSNTWSLFNNLLMPSLNRAISFSQMHYIAMLIRKDLKLYMSRLFYILFHIHAVIRKALYGFLLCGYKLFSKILYTVGYSHTLAAAAGSRFDHKRKAYLLCYLLGFFHIHYSPFHTGNDRYPCLDHGISCSRLISHHTDNIAAWAYKFYITLIAVLCKFGIFR